MDPVWGNLFDPQQLNRYAYVGNSPLRYVDPDGRMRLDADCQQLDLTFAKCAAYKAPDSFLAGVFGWQQFLRQGPTFSGGGPGGRRPKGPSEGGDGTDDSGGIDGSGDGNSNTNTNANNTGNNNNANSGQNTGDEGDASSDTSCSSQTRTDALGFSLNLTPLRGGEVGAGLAVQFRPVDVGVYGYFADTWGIGSGLTGVVTYVFGGINNTMKGRGTMAAVNPLLGRFGVAPSTAGRKITAISGGFGPSMGAWASPSVRTATWSVRGTCK